MQELQALDQWVCYSYPAKIPLNPKTGGNARSNDKTTWGTYAQAEKARAGSQGKYHGVGIVVTKENNITGIDFDDCISGNTIAPEVAKWVKRFNSFTYITPSGAGLRILVHGSIPKAITAEPFVDHVETYDHGRYFTITDKYLDGTPDTIESRQAELDEFYEGVLANRRPKAKACRELDKKIAELKVRAAPGRNSELSKVAFRAGVFVAQCGLLQDRIKESIWKACIANGLATTEQEPSLRTLNSQIQAGIRQGESATELPRYKAETAGATNGNGQHSSSAPDAATNERPYNRTDLGNAERFAAQYGERVRWCQVWNSWLIFNGKAWEQDRSGKVDRLAKATIRSIYSEATQEPDKAERKAIARHALASESSRAVRAMLDRAKSELPATPDEFNQAIHLLNCKNGTLDLRTGELHPHSPADMLTRCLKIDYNPLAPCPKWLQFIQSIFSNESSLIAFIQQALGMSLSGDGSEQCLFICHGGGSNGKTTLLEAVRIILASYGLAANIETFQMHKGERINNDVAELYGARFVTADENTSGSRLNEAFIKKSTGKQPLRARRLHENEFEFMPEFTVWFAVNHKPVVKDTSKGMWRRVHFIPFAVTIEGDQIDKHLGEKLLAESEGILAWLVQGCVTWYQQGRLNVPKIVQDATQSYRAEMDLVARFLDECCEIAANQETGATKLYQAYKTWCDEGGERWETQNNFGARLTERGYKKERTRSGYVYRGVNLVNLVNLKSDNFSRSENTNQKSATKGSQGSQGSQKDWYCITCGAGVEDFSRVDVDGTVHEQPDVPYCLAHKPAEPEMEGAPW